MAIKKTLRFDIDGSMNKEAADIFKALLEAYNDVLAKVDADMAAVNATLAKLDADAGVTDTDYAATNPVDVDYASTLALDIE